MFDLTKEERQVILFLLAVGLAGIGIEFYLKTHYQVKLSDNPINAHLGKINLNTVDKAALLSVSGIGEKLAQRIIEYRAEHGGFGSSEELRSIKGISGQKYEKIENSVYVE
jgi:competence ComEA-like helix-hairpin-helix protein